MYNYAIDWLASSYSANYAITKSDTISKMLKEMNTNKFLRKIYCPLKEIII